MGTEEELVFIGRIDRSIADNIKDIQTSFGDDAGIIKDLLVFFSTRMKRNLFSFMDFTLNDFAKSSGRLKSELCRPHPKFVKTEKYTPTEKPPEHNGHTFSTVFDYILYRAIQNNILFSKTYTYNSRGQELSLISFPILKEIILNFGKERNNGEVKHYSVRVSDEMIEGFIKRYYTMETTGYARVGKGKGGDGRKSLYILLYKTRHQLLFEKSTVTRFSVDFLCSVGAVGAVKPQHKKICVKRVLDSIRINGSMPFTYEFVAGAKSKEKYYVEVTFQEALDLIEPREDNMFFLALYENLKNAFQVKHGSVTIKNEIDPFQRWLSNLEADLDIKAEQYALAYKKAFSEEISISKAKYIIRTGDWIGRIKSQQNNGQEPQ